MFCKNCGAECDDQAVVCVKCGAATGVGAAETPGIPGTSDAQTNKLMAILAYIVFFVPLLTGAHKKSDFVKFHTNQGTVLAIASIGWAIVSSILSGVITSINYRLYWVGSIFSLVSLAIFILNIMGIINAANNKQEPLPIVGGFTILK